MGRRHRRKSKGLDQPAARTPLRQRNQRKVLAATEKRRQESASDFRRRAATEQRGKQPQPKASNRFARIAAPRLLPETISAGTAGSNLKMRRPCAGGRS